MILIGGMMWEEHDARQKDHKSKMMGGGEALMSLGSEDSDQCSKSRNGRRRYWGGEADN